MKNCYLCKENKNCKFYYGLSTCLGGSYYCDREKDLMVQAVASRCGFYVREGWRVRPDLIVKRRGYWLYNFIHYITYYIIGACEWLQRKSYRFHKIYPTVS